jgi:hypothetical protein
MVRSTLRFAPLLAVLAIVGSTAPAGAVDGSGAISLTIAPSVRGEAMGGLYTTLAQDYATRWGNPALLAFVERSTFGLMYSKLVPDLANDVFYFYGGYVMPTNSIGTLQFDLTYLSYGESEAVDSDGLSQGTFSSYEVSPAAAMGFKFLPSVGVGVAVKYVRIDLAPEDKIPDALGSGSGTGSSWAFDIGGIYAKGRVRAGGLVANLGPDISFIDAEQSDPMPRMLRLGGTYDVYRTEVGEVRLGYEWERSLVAWKPDTASDGFWSNLGRFDVHHFGGEFVYSNIFAVRGGYVHDSEGDVTAMTGGLGVRWGNAAFEYANAPQAEGLDRVHRFALWYRH